MAKKSRPERRPTPRTARGPNPIQKAVRYLGEVKTELRKTTFPDKPEMIASTEVVLGLVIAVGLFIYFMDTALAQVAKFLHLAPGS